ncbi:MAG: hypothetical protein ACK5X3_03795 [Pseudomonadota bacterium]|jgi:hypothetical protein
MKFKKFRDLVAGDRFLIPDFDWEVASGLPEPINDNRPNGLWKVYTDKGKAYSAPNELVTVED